MTRRADFEICENNGRNLGEIKSFLPPLPLFERRSVGRSRSQKQSVRQPKPVIKKLSKRFSRVFRSAASFVEPLVLLLNVWGPLPQTYNQTTNYRSARIRTYVSTYVCTRYRDSGPNHSDWDYFVLSKTQRVPRILKKGLLPVVGLITPTSTTDLSNSTLVLNSTSSLLLLLLLLTTRNMAILC
jgi:hypothetical protein